MHMLYFVCSWLSTINGHGHSKPSMFLGLVVQMSFYDDLGPTSYIGRHCDIHMKSAE